jgi:hypothetical protein
VDERGVSLVNETSHSIKLRRRRRNQETKSFYDNNEDEENEHIVSKWSIVRQRLPDILALSETYKPNGIRAQLVLLVALINKQSESANQSNKLNLQDKYNNTISHIVPTNVILDISGHRQIICLKRIPSEQVIHVDVDNLSFSIPTRQFILSISQGHTKSIAAKYCPPAISDMLIDLSKTKIIDDRRQYKRAQVKMRIGQTTFLIVFILIVTMAFALIIGATNAILKLDSFNQTFPYIPIGMLHEKVGIDYSENG